MNLCSNSPPLRIGLYKEPLHQELTGEIELTIAVHIGVIYLFSRLKCGKKSAIAKYGLTAKEISHFSLPLVLFAQISAIMHSDHSVMT